MALMPESDYKRMQAVVNNGLANPDLLTDWDVKFLTDFQDRFERFKRQTFVSEAQSDQFTRLEDMLQKELGVVYED